MCAAKTVPHFEEVLCIIHFVLMSHLGKSCDCSKRSNKKAAHLIVPFKSYKVNLNASASPLKKCISDQRRESVTNALAN